MSRRPFFQSWVNPPGNMILCGLAHFGYLPTVQMMIDSLVINKFLRTGIVTMPDNGTNSHPGNLEKMLCYVMSCGLDTTDTNSIRESKEAAVI
ncbi:MAG: hypothetical protein WCC17_24695 [Candidatus Nitrosopolaris sp.]